uniref:Uncharacterized protein n=1 Tax=Plectus sambesii TaxID=2011161 RepID=A0A914XK93_9BILA
MVKCDYYIRVNDRSGGSRERPSVVRPPLCSKGIVRQRRRMTPGATSGDRRGHTAGPIARRRLRTAHPPARIRTDRWTRACNYWPMETSEARPPAPAQQMSPREPELPPAIVS